MASCYLLLGGGGYKNMRALVTAAKRARRDAWMENAAFDHRTGLWFDKITGAPVNKGAGQEVIIFDDELYVFHNGIPHLIERDGDVSKVPISPSAKDALYRVRRECRPLLGGFRPDIALVTSAMIEYAAQLPQALSLVQNYAYTALDRVDRGELKYEKAINETKLMRDMKRIGQLYRVLRPIKREDEEGRVYDLATRFIEEYLNHPAPGAFKDLLDATSRVYDLEPKPPITINERDLEPDVYDD